MTYRDGPAADPRTFTNIVVYNLADGTAIAKYPASTTDSSNSGLTIDGRTYYPASPPVSHGSSLYFAGYNDASNLGVLARLDLVEGALVLTHYLTFGLDGSQTYGGMTGGSPLYVDSARFPKFPQDQVIIHVPQVTEGSVSTLSCRFVGAPRTGSHLVSFSSDLSTCYWAAALNPNGVPTQTSPLQVSPAVDPVIGGVWAWASNFLGWSGQELYHFPAAAGAFDRGINVPAICSAARAGCGFNPSFVGHLQAVNPPGTDKVYILSFLSDGAGLGNTKNAVAIDTSDGIGDSSRILWLAPIGGLTGRSFGGSFPLVTLPGDDGPAVVFSGGSFGTSVGNVSVVQP